MRPTTRSHAVVYDENALPGVGQAHGHPAKKVKTSNPLAAAGAAKPGQGLSTRAALSDISNKEHTLAGGAGAGITLKKPTTLVPSIAPIAAPAPVPVSVSVVGPAPVPAPVAAASTSTSAHIPASYAAPLPLPQLSRLPVPAPAPAPTRMSISASKPKHHFIIDAEDMEMKDQDMEAELEDGVNILSISSIDAADSTNAQAVTEYIGDIMSHFRASETRYLASSSYMSRQTDISVKMREILIDWLIEVHLKFKLQQETLYLTINLIDRFLERRHVGRTKLQLVGCTAMLIASKYEEIFPPEVRDFVFISDNAYTKEQIIQMECVMLKTLEFNITVPSALRFAERFVKVCGRFNDEVYRHLVSYLMEMTLQDYKFLMYKPSIIAASAVALTQAITAQQPWPGVLHSESGYSRSDLSPCIDDMLALYNLENPKYRAVRKKYSAKKFAEVAKTKIQQRPW